MACNKFLEKFVLLKLRPSTKGVDDILLLARITLGKA